MLAEQQSANCSSINWKEMKQHLITIKQHWWRANRVFGAVPNALHNMTAHGRACPRGRIMEVAAGGAGSLPPVRVTLCVGGLITHTHTHTVTLTSIGRTCLFIRSPEGQAQSHRDKHDASQRTHTHTHTFPGGVY